MPSVGAYLRELRERRGVSLEEIARSTRVLRRYLDALEADDVAALPAPVFAKGFIRSYCQALGVAPDEALALYGGRSAASGEGAGPEVVAGMRLEESGRRESRGRGAVLASFAMLAALGLALFAVTSWLKPPREHRAAAPAGEPRAIPGPAAQAPKAGPARPEAAAPAPTASEGPVTLASVTSPYRLVARTSELTWMRVRTEDGRTSQENIPAGETREWVSDRPFVLTVGNAGGVALELNGRRVPPLGPRGAVIERLVLPSANP